MIKYSKSYWDDIEEVIYSIYNKEIIFNKSILITGATGMIASTFAELLFSLNKNFNAQVKIFLASRNKEKLERRFPPFREGHDYFFIKYDAEKPLYLDLTFDYIIHGAGNADPASIINDPIGTITSNIYGLDSLLKVATKDISNPGRFLFISSSEIYGLKKNKENFLEDDYGFIDILNPRATYPNAKRCGESLCMAYSKEYGLDILIARPGHIYGPSISDTDSRASAQFTRKAFKKEDIVLKSSGSQLRSYCYTLDCASALLCILIKGKSGNAYNISNPNSIASIRDMAEAFAAISKTQVKFLQESSLEKISGNLMDYSVLDSNKLMALGWRPLFSLERGVTATFNFYKPSSFLGDTK